MFTRRDPPTVEDARRGPDTVRDTVAEAVGLAPTALGPAPAPPAGQRAPAAPAADGPTPGGVPAIERPLPTLAGARYEARSILGAGGMGEVWLSHDALIGRDVALKRLRAAQAPSEAARRRFLREARIQALMEHPTVVPVYDLNTAPDGSAYFTMRRVRGRPLDEVLQALASGDGAAERQYSRRKLLTALVNVCLAVHYAHTHGIVHRDLKPGNIMLGEFGEVYLLDWGVAKIGAPAPRPNEAEAPEAPTRAMAFATADLSANDAGALAGGLPAGNAGARDSGLTQSGQTIGTLGYMAPEQLRGEEVDTRADVYALGAILYEIVALRPLHAGANVVEMHEQMAAGTAIDPAAAEGVAPELLAACRRATAFAPADRFARARELADAIERYLDGDRDLEARRTAAAELTERARAATERAYAPESTPEASSAAHTEAMDAAMRALAFAPEDAAARNTLARLLVEVPEKLPQAAKAAQRQATENARLAAIRFAVYGFLSWVLVVPFVAWLGVRDWWPVVLSAASQVAGLGLSVHLMRRRNPGAPAILGLALLAFVPVSLFSVWLGPFVLVPVGAAVTTFIFASQALPRERLVVMGLGMLAAAAPFLAEWLGLVAPSYAFVDGTVVLYGRAIELPPTGTNIGLIYTSVAFSLGPTLFFAGVRDKLARAERRLFLQAWQLRRLSGEPDDQA